MAGDDEGVRDLREDVALHLGALPIAHIERRLLEHLHGEERVLVDATALAHEEHLYDVRNFCGIRRGNFRKFS